MIKSYLTYFVLFLTASGYGQQAAVYPDVLSTYFYNLSAINPGYVPQKAKADFASGYRFYQGQLKNVSSLSFSAAKIFRRENAPAHVLRLSAFNDQQGPYITSPKAYINYALQLPVGEETFIFSGIALGTSGVYFSAPTFSYSAFLPDGSFGLGINHKRVGLGLSSFQMFNSSAPTLGNTYKLGRYYHVNTFAEKELGPDWILKLYALLRNLPSSRNDVFGTVSFQYKDSFTVGTTVRYLSGTSFFMSVQLNPEENNLLVALTYNSAPLFTLLPSWQNSMEISLGFRLN